jgi:uncharacterized coiled-coil DUF342 family protein
MNNIYNQTYEVELDDLQNKLIDTQNTIINIYNIRDDIWKYHPSNENFINPIKEYEDLSHQIDELEKQISGIELKILHLKSSN